MLDITTCEWEMVKFPNKMRELHGGFQLTYNLKAVTILAMTTLQAALSLDCFVGAGLGGIYFKDEPLSLLRRSASKMSAKFD